MLAFIAGNIVTIVALLVVVLVVILVALRLNKNRKQGKTSCDFGGSCKGCPNSDLCHSPVKK